MVRDRPAAERETKTELRLPFHGTWSAMNAERNMSNRVGNSGHSSEPHLHFQLMDAPRLTVAHSLPARYDDVLVNGKLVKRA